MTSESDGKIKLTWQQVTYLVSLLVFLVLGYADIKNSLRDLRNDISGVYSKGEVYKKEEVYTKDQVDAAFEADRKRIRRIEKRLGINTD